jgi:hypothetical protein
MKTIIKQCLNCSKDFEANIAEHKRGNAKFCNRSCSSVFTRTREALLLPLNCKCHCCGLEFHRAANKIAAAKHGLNFCSRKCKETVQRIENGPNPIQPSHYKTGDFKYRDVAFRHYSHKCNRCDYNKLPILEVHHIDRNRHNNMPENLEILCPTCHCEEHYQANDGKWTK